MRRKQEISEVLQNHQPITSGDCKCGWVGKEEEFGRHQYDLIQSSIAGIWDEAYEDGVSDERSSWIRSGADESYYTYSTRRFNPFK